MEHKSGFACIIGLPNAGKSSLANALSGDHLSAITHKPQTTRHRIFSILNEDEYQIVLSDSPGFIDDPSYKLQESMNTFVWSSFDDADVLLVTQDAAHKSQLNDHVKKAINNSDVYKILILNKIDIATSEQIKDAVKNWGDVKFDEIIQVSATKKVGVDQLKESLINAMPEGPAYYPKDQITDRSYRFFTSEIIRAKILELYHDELPYSVQVIIDTYQDTKTNKGDDIARISADIYVLRESQKGIILGKGGTSIKRLGTRARHEIEKFIDKKVFLELRVKVKANWRNDERLLKHFGYQ
ncbi:UNVERIFIED_CONTAM: hypothetical protein GTU68_024184 [Idotea baltica]|nr:hypothetical protein [Idotea baltica]